MKKLLTLLALGTGLALTGGCASFNEYCPPIKDYSTNQKGSANAAAALGAAGSLRYDNNLTSRDRQILKDGLESNLWLTQ